MSLKARVISTRAFHDRIEVTFEVLDTETEKRAALVGAPNPNDMRFPKDATPELVLRKLSEWCDNCHAELEHQNTEAAASAFVGLEAHATVKPGPPTLRSVP